MVRRLVVTLCLIAGLIGASFGTAHAATTAPEKWAPKFCTAFHKWQSTLESTSNNASSAASATDLTTAHCDLDGIGTISPALMSVVLCDCAIARAGWLTFNGTPSQGSAKMATTVMAGGMSSSPNQAGMTRR